MGEVVRVGEIVRVKEVQGWCNMGSMAGGTFGQASNTPILRVPGAWHRGQVTLPQEGGPKQAPDTGGVSMCLLLRANGLYQVVRKQHLLGYGWPRGGQGRKSKEQDGSAGKLTLYRC